MVEIIPEESPSSPTTTATSSQNINAEDPVSLSLRLRASLHYTRDSLRSSLLGGKPALRFNEQLEKCRSSSRQSRKSEFDGVGMLQDLEFSDHFQLDDGPKNSDEAKEQRAVGMFGFVSAWGSQAQPTQPEQPESSRHLAAEPTGTPTSNKQPRRDSGSSHTSTVSAQSLASAWSNLWSRVGGNNNDNAETTSNPPKSTKIESALGKLDREQEGEEDSEEFLFKS